MNKKLISATLVKQLEMAQVALLQNQFGYGVLYGHILSGISIYKIIYSTTYVGREINASGLLMLPHNLTHQLPVITIHNGTTFLKSEAPSVFIDQGGTGYEFFAASGYITLIPDYIGYGESNSEIHPYYDAAHSASCVIDMLAAAQEYIVNHGIPCNKKLFLTGYSEGGFITLAVLKSLEQHNDTFFHLVAAAAGAGGFDLFSMLASLSTGHSTHIQPAYITYLIMAYRRVYPWQKPLTYYFNRKYARMIPELFSGKHDKQYINDKLGTDLVALFNPTFYTNLKGNGEMELKKALFANSLSNWCPEAKLNLYHGTIDDVIPYQNTEITYQKMIENGAKQVQYFPIANADHHAAQIPMLELVKPWFDSLK